MRHALSRRGQWADYLNIQGCRITTESGVPVSTSDRTSQGNLYLTPANGNLITLPTGVKNNWVTIPFDEQILGLTVTSGKNYDLFAYLLGDSGFAYDLGTAWTDDTTRALAVELFNGYYVNSSAFVGLVHGKTIPTRRGLLVGTIRGSAANATEDSAGGTTTQVGGKRFVYSAFNQVERRIAVIDTADAWPYRTGTWRQQNSGGGANGNKVEYISGSAVSLVNVRNIQTVALLGNTARAAVGIGIDSTTTPSGFVQAGFNGNATNYVISAIAAEYSGAPGLGYHVIYPIEFGATDAGAGDCQFTGDNATDQQTGFVAKLFM